MKVLLLVALVQQLVLDEKPVLDLKQHGENQFIQIAGASLTSDGSVAVADAGYSSVFFFNKAGKPTYAFGKDGSGPNEFQSMAWVGNCGSTFQIYDPLLARVTEITHAGKFVEMQINKFSTTEMRCVGKTQIRSTRSSDFEQTKSLKVGPHRGTMSVVVGGRTIGTFAGTERFRTPTGDVPRPFGKQLVFAVSQDRVYVGTADSFYVQVFDFSGKKVGEIKQPWQPRKFTTLDRDKYFESRIVSAKQRGRGINMQAFMDRVNTLSILPDYFPAYEKFVATETGIWIQEPFSHANKTRVWHGFNSSYQPTGRLVVPVEFDVTEIRGNFALGTWTDAEGTESVRLYRLAVSL